MIDERYILITSRYCGNICTYNIQYISWYICKFLIYLERTGIIKNSLPGLSLVIADLIRRLISSTKLFDHLRFVLFFRRRSKYRRVPQGTNRVREFFKILIWLLKFITAVDHL